MQDPNQFLAGALLALGALGILAGAAAWFFPAPLRAALEAFPRSKWPGWLLAAIGVFWIAWVVNHAALGRFTGLKPFVPFAAVALFAGMVWLLDELLAPRALGGLLLLIANPLLNGVRWADSAWRLVPVLIAYAWVIAGCMFLLHPWSFRKLARFVAASDGRVRLTGVAKLVAGAVLLGAGWWCLR